MQTPSEKHHRDWLDGFIDATRDHVIEAKQKASENKDGLGHIHARRASNLRRRLNALLADRNFFYGAAA